MQNNLNVILGCIIIIVIVLPLLLIIARRVELNGFEDYYAMASIASLGLLGLLLSIIVL